jgi:hypothetical protein
MAAFPPILGHATVTNGYLCTCESVYMDVIDHDMPDAVSKMSVNSLKWLVGPDPSTMLPMHIENGTMLMRASEVYMNGGPLYAYDNHSVVESTNHSTHNSFWQSLYLPLESVECHYGAIGLCTTTVRYR